MIEPIKEFQLKNHLAGSPTNTTNPNIVDPYDTSLARDDFQLFEALKILHTMYTLNQEAQAIQANR